MLYLNNFKGWKRTVLALVAVAGLCGWSNLVWADPCTDPTGSQSPTCTREVTVDDDAPDDCKAACGRLSKSKTCEEGTAPDPVGIAAEQTDVELCEACGGEVKPWDCGSCDAPGSMPSLGERVQVLSLPKPNWIASQWGDHISFGANFECNYIDKVRLSGYAGGKYASAGVAILSAAANGTFTGGTDWSWSSPAEWGGATLTGSGGTEAYPANLHLAWPHGVSWDFELQETGSGTPAAWVVYRVTKRTTKQGFETTITHNTTNVTITDASGHDYVLDHDAEGVISKISVGGRDWTYVNSSGYLKETNGQTSFTHETWLDGSSRVTKMRQAQGTDEVVVEQFFESWSARRTKVTKNAAVWTFVYDWGTGKTTETGPGGRTLTWDTDGATKNSLGQESTITVIEGKMTGFVDPKGNAYSFQYDSRGYLTKRTNPGSIVKSWHYDTKKNLTKMIAPQGTWLGYYDSNNRPTKEVNPLGGATIYYLDSNGLPTKIKDPLLNETQYFYNGMGQVTKKISPLGAITLTYYDSWGNRTKVTDPNNNSTSYSYDGADRLTNVTDALGHSTTYEHDFLDRKTKETDATGASTEWYYDAGGRCTKIAGSGGGGGCAGCGGASGGSGEPGDYYWDAGGRLTKYVDLNSHATTYLYNSAGQRTKAVDARNYATSYYLDANRNITKTVDANGNATSYYFDNDDRLTKQTTPAGATTYAYDALGQQTLATDAEGGSTKTYYDALGRVTKSEDALNRATSYLYDVAGNQTKAIYADSSTVTYIYDADYRVTKTIDALNHETISYYDIGGRVTKTVDPLSHATSYLYDATNRLTEQTDALSNSTTYEYDNVNRQTKVTDGAGRSTSTAYNSRGWMTSSSDGATTTSYEYDLVGNQTKMTVSGRAAIVYFYNDTNHLTKTEQTSGLITLTTTQTVDGVGNVLTSRDSGSKTTNYYYDDANRLTRETNPESEATDYAHDGVGRRTKTTLANGSSRESYYDAAGQLTKTTSGPEGDVSYAYDTRGRQTQVTDANSRDRGSWFDALGRMTKQTNEMSQATTYAYDAAGNRTSLTDAESNTTSYLYDAANRLTKMTYANNDVESYLNDGGGLVTKKTKADSSTISYTYNGAGALATVGGTTYTRDSAGAVTGIDDSVVTMTYGYDGFGRMTRAVDSANGTIDYLYDLRGLRTKMTAPGSNTVEYAYDDAMRLTLVKKNGETTGAAYSYDNGGRRTKLTLENGVQTTYSYSGTDQLTKLETKKDTTTLASFSYSLDATGNRTKIIYADASRSEYHFDGAYRLTKEKRASGSGEEEELHYEQAFWYDTVGNRTKMIGKEITEYKSDANTAGLWHLDVGGAGFTVPSSEFTSDTDTALLYHLEESDEALDSSVNNNDGILSGNPSTLQEGKFNDCIQFDGTDDYIEAADDASLEFGSDDFTIEAWIRPTDLNDLRMIACKWDGIGDQRGWYLRVQYGGKLAFGLSSAGTAASKVEIASNEAVISANEWNHVALVRKDDVVTAFANGQRVMSVLWSGAVFNNSKPVHVGAYKVGAMQAFAGKIDEVRLSTVARYETTQTPDASGNANHGDLIGHARIADQGRFSRAIELDGADDFIRIKDNAAFTLGSSDFTIEAWVKPDAVDVMRMVACHWDGPTNQRAWFLRVQYGGKVALCLDSDGAAPIDFTLLTAAGVVSTGEWTHIAAARDGDTVTVYVNGESKATDTFTGSVKDSTAPLAIGNYPPQGDNQSFDGLIDEVRISKADRSEELNETTVNYYYNSANQLTKSTSGNWEALYTYDPNGNQTKIVESADTTTIATKTMEYDSFDRMTKWTGPAGAESSAYRGAEWHRKSIGSTDLLYDGDNVIADKQGGGVAKFYVTPFLDQNLSMTADSSTYYYSQDGLGSVRTLTDSTGTLTNNYDYAPFGGPYALNTSVTVSQRYSYTGREANPVSPTMYYRHRTYLSRIGRFVQRDPILYAGGINLYEYASSRPINVTDAHGLKKRYYFKKAKNIQYNPNLQSNGVPCFGVMTSDPNLDCECRCRVWWKRVFYGKWTVVCFMQFDPTIGLRHGEFDPGWGLANQGGGGLCSTVAETARQAGLAAQPRSWQALLQWHRVHEAVLYHERAHEKLEKMWYDSRKGYVQKKEGGRPDFPTCDIDALLISLALIRDFNNVSTGFRQPKVDAAVLDNTCDTKHFPNPYPKPTF